jgi:hypothetical protein
VALFLVAAYLSMAVFSGACPFEHHGANPTGHHPHHGSGSAHTPFCAWACQANQTIDLLAAGPPTHSLHLIGIFLLVSLSAPSLLGQLAASSRAPPQR